MSIRSFCDICEELAESNDFYFEANIIETISPIVAQDPNYTKHSKKSNLHVCEDCYKTKLKPILYDTKKK